MNALEKHGGTLEYGSVLQMVFPPSDYPDAYRKSHRGGPPACAMPLGRALRKLEKLGQIEDRIHDHGRTIRLLKRINR